MSLFQTLPPPSQRSSLENQEQEQKQQEEQSQEQQQQQTHQILENATPLRNMFSERTTTTKTVKKGKTKTKPHTTHTKRIQKLLADVLCESNFNDNEFK